MIEKNYESKKELKSAFEESIEKLSKVSESKYVFYSVKPKLFNEILINIRNHDNEKLIESFKKSKNAYLLYGSTLNLDNSENNFNSRLIYLLKNEQVSIFDVYDWTVEEVEELLNSLKIIDTTTMRILYSYFVLKNKFDIAEKIFKLFVEYETKNFDHYYDAYTISIISEISNEYIPVFNYYEKQEENKINKYMIENYLKSIYNTNGYLKNDFNRSFYNNIYKKYKNIIKNINTSSFFNDNGIIKIKSNAPIINDFDLIESDPAAKEYLFRVFNYNFAKTLKDLLERDAERTQKLMYDYLNTTHHKGKKKRQFLLTYNRLKDILEEKGLKIDPFKLNEELQSHIVLDILN
jgi:hypothetical protein